jgi:hypothetical protein
VVASASIVAKDMVSIDDFIKDVTFKPCFLYEVVVKLFEFHGGNKVFIPGVIVWVVRAKFFVRVGGAAAKSLCILGDNFTDDVPSRS